MSYKHRRYARSFVRSFLSFVFSRCGRFISRKIIPFCLCFVALGLSLTVPSFAASDEGTDDINVADMSYYSTYIVQGDFQPLPVTRSHFAAGNYGYDCYGYYLPETANGSFKTVTAYNLENFVGGHEYNIQFHYRVGYRNFLNFSLQISFYDGNGQPISSQVLYSGRPAENNSWVDVNLNFQVDNSSISSGYQCRLEFVFSDSISSGNWYYLSDPIYLNDNDDESGLLHSIIEWLRTIRDKLIDLSSSITTGFSGLGTRIGNFFADLKQGFIDKLESVKTAITNAIDGIEQWFIDLKDNLVDGLKSLFIPRDGYFASKKQELDTFMTNHFGAVWQAPGVVVDFLRKLVNLQPSEDFTIQVPAIQFKFDINPFDSVGAQTYTLLEAQTYSFNWVNDTTHPVHYFYVFYKGFVLLILLFALIQYLMGKFDVIVAGLPNFERD